MEKLKRKVVSFVVSFCIVMSSVTVVSPTTVQADTTYVYIASSGRGSCYHSNKKCSNMKGTVRLKVSEAKSRGYRPCKKCY